MLPGVQGELVADVEREEVPVLWLLVRGAAGVRRQRAEQGRRDVVYRKSFDHE